MIKKMVYLRQWRTVFELHVISFVGGILTKKSKCYSISKVASIKSYCIISMSSRLLGTQVYAILAVCTRFAGYYALQYLSSISVLRILIMIAFGTRFRWVLRLPSVGFRWVARFALRARFYALRAHASLYALKIFCLKPVPDPCASTHKI